MTQIYLANTCLSIPNLNNQDVITASSGSVAQILDTLNGLFPGLKPRVVDANGHVRSNALLIKNISFKDGRMFIDKRLSHEIRRLEERLEDNDNLLVSVFDLHFFENLLSNGLVATDKTFEYVNEEGRPNRQKFRGYVEAAFQSEEEPVYGFTSSSLELAELAYPVTEEMCVNFRQGDTTLDRFRRDQCRLIPAPLKDAIYDLLIDPQEERQELHLRLFQEDALFFMLGKLWEPESIPEEALLLSIPTGGGKTEAFMFPLVSHLLARKVESIKQGNAIKSSVKALVLYPTKALANDQAKRLAEVVYRVQQSIDRQDLPSQVGITIGIFTGDTPSNRDGLFDGLGNFLSLFQICPACDQAHFELEERTVDGKSVAVQRCKNCGELMHYARVTRTDILNAPPDILITNPDTLNYHIQIPDRQALFVKDVEIVIFDEVHEYNGIFGCNVAHLLSITPRLRMTPRLR